MPEGALAQKLTRKNRSSLREVCPSASTKVFQQHCELRCPPNAVSRGGFVSPTVVRKSDFLIQELD